MQGVFNEKCVVLFDYKGRGEGVSRTAVGHYNQNVDGVLCRAFKSSGEV